MRNRVINYLRVHPHILGFFWKLLNISFKVLELFIPIREKTILFASYGGRKFDDSPKAIYDEILNRDYFSDWEIIWAFVDPDKFDIPRGEKIKIDTRLFFKALLYSKIWVSNSGMDRNIGIDRKETIKVETWHGTPIKKLASDQNSGALGNFKPQKQKDNRTIRCAQSEYDLDIFKRIFNATRDSFILSDLPRNDALTKWTEEEKDDIKNRLGIAKSKKIILYMPTYREYLIDKENGYYFKNPIDIKKWEDALGENYIVLFRAHYAVATALHINFNDFIIDVSDYPTLNDLYIVSDILISDYSSAFFDYSILERPMLCYAFDYEEYKEKRGLYIDLEKELPCDVNTAEDEVIKNIIEMDFKEASKKSRAFHLKYTPNAGNACRLVVNELMKRLHNE